MGAFDVNSRVGGGQCVHPDDLLNITSVLHDGILCIYVYFKIKSDNRGS